METNLSCECYCHRPRQPKEPHDCCTLGRTRGDGMPPPAKVRCIFCDEVLALAPVIESWVDAEGYERCPDGGWHRPVITVEALA